MMNPGVQSKNFSGKGEHPFVKNVVSFILTFMIMFAMWLIFSGIFESFFLWMGIISSLLVATISHNLILPNPNLRYFKQVPGFILYLPWLIFKVFQANIHILKLVFHPRMRELIDPHITTFNTSLRKDLSLVTMANSITLTPGTITISVDTEGSFRVHAIDKKSAEGLPGPMAEKLERIFED